MPGVYDYNSVNDAWRNSSVMDMVNNQVAQPTQPTPQPTPQSTEGIVQPSVQNLQQPNNSVFNQTHRAETPQPVPTQPTTQIATQGMGRRPTLQDYQAFALDYLAKKGYDYDEAMELMRPEFQAYAVREQAQNRALADDLIGRMQTMDIASPEYRQAAFQLYRLDPKMGQFMLKEGIGPRELYQHRQKREDAAYNNEMSMRNYLRKLGIQEERQQRAIADKVQQLIDYGGLDRRTAMQMVLFGGGRNGKGFSFGQSSVSEKDYKRAADGLKALDDEIAEGMLANPKFQLSPEKQQQYNMLYAIKQRGDMEFYQRNGVGVRQQQAPRQKVNFNDYNSLKPAIDNLVKQNGGKFDESIARFIRQKAGIGADNKNPEEFLNVIFKNTYGFSG